MNIKGILWVTDQVLVQKSRLNIWYSKKTKVPLYDFGELKFSKSEFPEDDDNIYPVCSLGTLNEMMVVVVVLSLSRV